MKVFSSTVPFLIHLIYSAELQEVVHIDSPRPGSVLDVRNPLAWSIQVRVRKDHQEPNSELVVECDGVELERTKDDFYEMSAASKWSPGFHNLSAYLAERNGNIIYMDVSHFLVVDIFVDSLQPLECPHMTFNPVADEISHERGFGSSKWRHHRKCLEVFLGRFPTSVAAQYQYGKLLEAEGFWTDAAKWYRGAGEGGLIHPNGASYIHSKVSTMLSLAKDQTKRQQCSWMRVESCNLKDGATQKCITDDQSEHECANLTDGQEDLYLSVVMVTRHDNTQYCQVPRDACLDRLRASMSILLRQLSSHGLAENTEVILVEWNPCYLNSRQDEGTCDPRQDGYMSLEEAVRTLVEIPPHPVLVRIMLVSQQTHEALYNPYDFDLMEFIGKNAAARRARGRFILFTNPDDCLTESMASLLGRRRLREDVVYSTFRGAVDGHIPVGRGATAESMARFVQGNSFSSEDQPLSIAHKAGRWRRAGCLAGEEDEAPMQSGRYGYFHDSAAGDFLLMAKSAFLSFRGYAEIPTNIMIDGTAIHAAAAHGYGQLVLAGQCFIVHQPHPRSYNTRGSMMSLTAYEELAQQLLDAGPLANLRDEDEAPHGDVAQRPWHRWNGPEWGLGGTELVQVVLRPVCA